MEKIIKKKKYVFSVLFVQYQWTPWKALLMIFREAPQGREHLLSGLLRKTVTRISSVLPQKDNKKHAKISVQYSSYEDLKFFQRSTTMNINAVGDAYVLIYVLSCKGAEKEHIFFYPSINNVLLGGQEKYEARAIYVQAEAAAAKVLWYTGISFHSV